MSVLSQSARFVYLCLCKHADNTNQTCFPSLHQIAQIVGKSISTIKRAVRELCKYSAIERTSRLDYELKEELSGLYKYIRDIDEIKLNSKVFSNVILHRNNHYYRFLMNICQVIYESLFIDENTGNTKFQVFERDEAKMALLFENFVRNFYKREQKEYRVCREDIYWNDIRQDPHDKDFLPKMQADTSLVSDKRKIIIDTKYSKNTLSNRGKVKAEN